MSSLQFPAAARVFLAISTPARSRIFLYDEGARRGSSDAMTSVATVPGTVDAATLVDELNRAAYTGDRVAVDAILRGLPSAVAQAIGLALETCPEPDTLALGVGDQPMSVLRESFHYGDTEDLALQANSAMNLGLQFLIQNSLDEERDLEFTSRLLSGETEVVEGHDWSWWPSADLTLSERLHPDPDDLAEALGDTRWETNVGRVYWLWVEDREQSGDGSGTTATVEWVVEFFDQPLGPDTSFRIFEVRDEGDDSYLTARNRFFLWRSLWNISVDLDGALFDLDGDGPGVEGMESMVRDDMPSIVHRQPRVWWEQLRDEADRLCEAARVGEFFELQPRTVGEEALIALAVREGYIDWARDSFEMDNYQQVFDSLPTSSDDGEWGEILPELTGDTDVEMLWQPHLDGIDDPANELNRGLGIGDYRPAAWHELFDRAKGRE